MNTELATTEKAGQLATATQSDITAPIDRVVSVTGNDEVVRTEVTVRIPPTMMYVMGNKSLLPTSDAYDRMNRVLGVQFQPTDLVPDDTGKLVSNPIHREDYIYLRLAGIWHNDVGQLVRYVEDVEVDYRLRYEAMIVNSRSYEVEFSYDEHKRPILNDRGFPVHTFKIDKVDFVKAQRELYRLRMFGIRYAYSVAKVRILKTATGIKSFPFTEGNPAHGEEEVWSNGSKHWKPKPRWISVNLVGFKDNLEPDERWERALKDADSLYGPRPESAKITDEDRSAIVDADVVDNAASAPAAKPESQEPFDADAVAREFGEQPPPDAR